ncbi:MAG: hypothetical protein AB8B86_14240 [Pseudomonadales bacterium]
MEASRLNASFRDPSGFVFTHEGTLYRQINRCYSEQFDAFISSGLYERLVKKNYLVPHRLLDVDEAKQIADLTAKSERYAIVEPEALPFISYPFEWSFSQLKDAAMLTLRVHLMALNKGFVLKDASAYNVQFHQGRAIFIDTLSFEPYTEDQPWVAYKQFCQHFLAPLALMAHCGIEMGKLLTSYIDGIPLDLASKLLPKKSRLNFSLMAHIHAHARLQRNHADSAAQSSKDVAETTLTLRAQKALIESLGKAIDKLEWRQPDTEWGDYYNNTNYTNESASQKRELVAEFLQAIPDTLHVVQDLGANRGEFSRVAAQHASLVISQDIDPVAVEQNYLQVKHANETGILPLLQDLFAPSPAIGWANAERDSFMQRGQCSAVMALALIHHLAISNNVPLGHIATLFTELGEWLIIEFVPKADSQVERLLATRDDIFPDYTDLGFEAAFGELYDTRRKQRVGESERTLYLLQRKS